MKTTIQTMLLPTQQQILSLRKLMNRETRIINRILGIIRYRQDQIFSKTKSGRYRTSRKLLAELMLSTRTRTVPHDLKKEFLNISHNELMECIDNASEMALSYLELLSKQDRTYPKLEAPISRRIGYRRFRIDRESNILSIIDSRESNYKMIQRGKLTTRHNYLDIEYVMNERLQDHLDLGTAKSITIHRSNNRYYANITIDIVVPQYKPDSSKQLGIIGIDLGISKNMTAVLYTSSGIVERKVFADNNLRKQYGKVERKVAILQSELHLRATKQYRRDLLYYRSKIADPSIKTELSNLVDILEGHLPYTHQVERTLQALSRVPYERYEQRLQRRLNDLLEYGHQPSRNVVKSLYQIKNRRANLKRELINQMAAQLQQYVRSKMDAYNLHVVIGDPSGIRYRARRGNGRKALRKKVNFWAFHMVSQQVAHNMAKLGREDRFFEVSESWTSIMCYRCNTKGARPKQSLFVCNNPRCQVRINADVNGATNIAKRGILYRGLVATSKLHDYYITKKKTDKRTHKAVA